MKLILRFYKFAEKKTEVSVGISMSQIRAIFPFLFVWPAAEVFLGTPPFPILPD
jgi:hypothetical protein